MAGYARWSRAWRNNNPGNITAGKFASRHGAIGQDGKFAIFPDAETGHRAAIALLNSSGYRNLTLEQAIGKWAPRSENNTEAYIAEVSNLTGFVRDTALNSLTPAQIEAVAHAMKHHEGWTPGTVRVEVGSGS